MPAAFFTSLILHGLVVAVLFLAAYSASYQTKPETKVFELVAGEGDNFAATEAPALGSPTGIKLTLPTPPTPKAEPVKPAITQPEPQPEPVPVVSTPPTPPAPKPTPTPPPEVVKKEPSKAPPTKTASTKTKTIAEQMRWEAIKAESKIKQQVAREKAAEKKRLDKERQEQARAAAQAAAAKAPQVDALGIAKGVRDGSTANKDGGAGGKALSRSDGPVMDAYFAMLKQKLGEELKRNTPPGISDDLVSEAEFRLGADGSISAVKIISPSGSAEFDRAVLDVFARVRMPVRPDGKSSVQTTRFRTKDLEGR